MVESDYNGTFKLWMPQATTHEWTKLIADWWTAVYPTTDLDLAANLDLASNLNFSQPLFPLHVDWHPYR
jgi:hypothetical protein